MVNPWLMLAAILGVALAGGGAYLKGRADGRAIEVAAQASAEAIRMETLHLAMIATAEEIAKIQVKHTTIRQTAEQVIREVPVYRDCVNDPAVRGLLDAARENRDIAPGGRLVPGAGVSPASNFR